MLPWQVICSHAVISASMLRTADFRTFVLQWIPKEANSLYYSHGDPCPLVIYCGNLRQREVRPLRLILYVFSWPFQQVRFSWSQFCFFFKILFIHFQGEGKGRIKRRRAISMCGCLLQAPYWGPGLKHRHVPWQELNQQPFSSWGSAQATRPHQKGHECMLNAVSYLEPLPNIDMYMLICSNNTHWKHITDWKFY